MFGEDTSPSGHSGKKERTKQTARKTTGSKPPAPRRPRAPSKAKATTAAKKATLGASSRGKRGSSGEPSEMAQMFAESLKVQEGLAQLGVTMYGAQAQLKAPGLKMDDTQAAILDMLRDIRMEMKEMREEFRYDMQEVTERLDMLVGKHADIDMDDGRQSGSEYEFD